MLGGLRIRTGSGRRLSRRLGRVRVPQQFRTISLDPFALGALQLQQTTVGQFNIIDASPLAYSLGGAVLSAALNLVGTTTSTAELTGASFPEGSPEEIAFTATLLEGTQADPSLLPTP